MTKNQNETWAVVGAGPGGIAAVGKLLDLGVAPDNITWIDPEFSVGDFGTRWCNIPSNTQVKLFIAFLESYESFDFSSRSEKFELESCDPDATCALKLMAEPLQWVTNNFCKKVKAVKSKVEKMHFKDAHWHLETEKENHSVNKVILTIGSEPKLLSHPELEQVSLEYAMDPSKLKDKVNKDDTVALFGSSHSAILAMRYCCEIGVKKIINFNISPLRFALDMGNWILFDDVGLKGTTAQWAKENLLQKSRDDIERYYSSSDNINRYIERCNKAIYAVGFQRRHLYIERIPHLNYDPYTGIIAPGLFGFGIAFPQMFTDPLGNKGYRVGLWKFMQYLDDAAPIWLRY